MALTAKQRLFVDYYLGQARGNGSEAARLAGYAKGSAHAQACKLLGDAKIQAVLEESLRVVGVTRERVLLRLLEQAFGDLGEFLEMDEEGRLQLRLLKRGKRWRLAGPTRLLKAVSVSQAHGVRVELHDPQRALMLLGRYLGLWSGREAPDGAEELDDLAAAILASARAANGTSFHSAKGEESEA